MSTILINPDKVTIAILSELAKKLGGTVINIDDAQLEDFALGLAMEQNGTGETIGIEEVRKILKDKS